MQNPPPGPPPGEGPGYQPPPSGGGYQQDPGGYQPPPSYQPQGGYQPQAAGSGTSGMDTKTGAIIAYVLWWITGLIMFFVGQGNRNIRYHGAQSLIFFGGITVVNIVINIINSIISAATGSLSLSVILSLITFVIWLFGVVVWIICLVRAVQGNGERFQIPLVGGFVTPYAERLAGG